MAGGGGVMAGGGGGRSGRGPGRRGALRPVPPRRRRAAGPGRAAALRGGSRRWLGPGAAAAGLGAVPLPGGIPAALQAAGARPQRVLHGSSLRRAVRAEWLPAEFFHFRVTASLSLRCGDRPRPSVLWPRCHFVAELQDAGVVPRQARGETRR